MSSAGLVLLPPKRTNGILSLDRRLQNKFWLCVPGIPKGVATQTEMSWVQGLRCACDVSVAVLSTPWSDVAGQKWSRESELDHEIHPHPSD